MNWQILIKDIRKEMLISQEDLARELDVAYCTVNRYENGHFEPTLKVQRELKRLAKANGIDWDKYIKR